MERRRAPSIHLIFSLSMDRELLLSWCVLRLCLDGRETSMGNGFAVREFPTAPDEPGLGCSAGASEEPDSPQERSGLQQGNILATEKGPGTPLLQGYCQQQQLKLLQHEKLPQGHQSTGTFLWETLGLRQWENRAPWGPWKAGCICLQQSSLALLRTGCSLPCAQLEQDDALLPKHRPMRA